MNDLLLQPHEAYVNGGLDSLLRGSLVETAAPFDSHLSNPIENLFLNDPTKGLETHRFSLGALDINRGRDHGLQPYTAYRTFCGLKSVESFDELEEIPRKTIADLKKAYKNVDDIDLWVGITSEKPISGAVVGPTAACEQYFTLFFNTNFSIQFFYVFQKA